MKRKEYWASFEWDNGGIGTWSAGAVSPDAFITDLIRREIKRAEGLYIKRFLELFEQIEDGLEGKKLSVREYNLQLKKQRGKQ